MRNAPTTALKPEEVHDLGLRDVTRIETEMRAILVANGYAARPIGEAMVALGKDPRFEFDQREFHDVVIRNGALPLGILEEQVMAYIQRTK